MRTWLVKARGSRSQREVAENVGISRSAYANIETGRRSASVKVAKKIASELKLEWLIFFDDK
ncbi:XRE family transcriptional regulator [Bacillus sp. C1-1]|nr:XRE family transcriptional regulator [Bacillus sp. C1-1]